MNSARMGIGHAFTGKFIYTALLRVDYDVRPLTTTLQCLHPIGLGSLIGTSRMRMSANHTFPIT